MRAKTDRHANCLEGPRVNREEKATLKVLDKNNYQSALEGGGWGMGNPISVFQEQKLAYLAPPFRKVNPLPYRLGYR